MSNSSASPKRLCFFEGSAVGRGEQSDDLGLKSETRSQASLPRSDRVQVILAILTSSETHVQGVRRDSNHAGVAQPGSLICSSTVAEALRQALCATSASSDPHECGPC
jgi:hypothetical protein